MGNVVTVIDPWALHNKSSVKESMLDCLYKRKYIAVCLYYKCMQMCVFQQDT